MYIKKIPLDGSTYDTDRSQAIIIITSLVVSNNEAETKKQSLLDCLDGRVMIKILNEHYLSIGLYETEITQIVDILKNFFYSGERPLIMSWVEFKRRLR